MRMFVGMGEDMIGLKGVRGVEGLRGSMRG